MSVGQWFFGFMGNGLLLLYQVGGVSGLFLVGCDLLRWLGVNIGLLMWHGGVTEKIDLRCVYYYVLLRSL